LRSNITTYEVLLRASANIPKDCRFLLSGLSAESKKKHTLSVLSAFAVNEK
jgi:hypothetical protein